MIRQHAPIVFLALCLSGCGADEPPPPASFAPLDYGYLKKLRLNVGDIAFENDAQALGEQDVSGQSPVPPAQALMTMAHERLFAAGASGRAVFVIDRASILRGPEGAYNGELDVHLNVTDANGTHAGSAEAHVARQHVQGSDPENTQVVLYDMTKGMMDDMNVELEYQLKRTLRPWLADLSAVPAPVTAQPLAPVTPVQAEPALPSFGSPAPYAPPALPPAAPPDATQDQTPPPQMSPPPGVLQLPPGYQRQPPYPQYQPQPYQPQYQPQPQGY
jgi:hypothetical protein